MTLDLEMNQPSNRIIQVGIIAADLYTGEIKEELSMYINPKEQLSEYIINLTGITQDQVDNGIELENAHKVLLDFKKRHNCFHNPITWGCGDTETLLKQLGIDKKDYVFGRSFFDAKKLFQTYCLVNELKLQSGLSKSMNRLGLTFEGRKHDAKYDARNTFKIYRYLMQFLKKGEDSGQK